MLLRKLAHNNPALYYADLTETERWQLADEDNQNGFEKKTQNKDELTNLDVSERI